MVHFVAHTTWRRRLKPKPMGGLNRTVNRPGVPETQAEARERIVQDLAHNVSRKGPGRREPRTCRDPGLGVCAVRDSNPEPAESRSVVLVRTHEYLLVLGTSDVVASDPSLLPIMDGRFATIGME
jgi:hypothetical protein